MGGAESTKYKEQLDWDNELALIPSAKERKHPAESTQPWIKRDEERRSQKIMTAFEWMNSPHKMGTVRSLVTTFPLELPRVHLVVEWLG